MIHGDKDNSLLRTNQTCTRTFKPVLKLQLGALLLIACAPLFAIATYVPFAERVKWSWFLAACFDLGKVAKWRSQNVANG